MIRNNIFIMGMSLSVFTIYSCSDGKKSSETHKTEKSRSYIKFNLISDDLDSTAGSSRAAKEIYSFAEKVNTYTINVTVKCDKGLSATENFEETFEISDVDVNGIPVVKGKDCDLTFNSFTLGDKFDSKTKLVLKYAQATDSILQSDTVGYYEHNTTYKYVNGSKVDKNPLNIYIANSPDSENVAPAEDKEKVIEATDTKLEIHQLKAPEAFPLKITKYKVKLGSNVIAGYKYNISNTSGKTDWPNNCKIISSDVLESPNEWDDVNKVYLGSSATACTNINLNELNNWFSKKDKDNYIILATDDTDSTIHKAYRVIMIPAIM